MSFDFMVFDASVPPRTDDGFKRWYEDEISDANGVSSNDSAVLQCASLREFYGQMREMFTPFNGPDDVPLTDDASQARILRTCEYFFRPHSIYMCFRWAAQDMARGTASTFAKEFALGYYHLSTKHGQAVFPDGTKVWPGGKYAGYGAGKNLT